MNYTLIVKSNHLNNSSRALQSAREIIASNQINLIYFLFDGAYTANKFIDMPTDEPSFNKLWADFAVQNDLTLYVCAASGLRRGITEATISHPFAMGSIGQLVEACDNADKVVTL